jgi:hypothetical protein
MSDARTSASRHVSPPHEFMTSPGAGTATGDCTAAYGAETTCRHQMHEHLYPRTSRSTSTPQYPTALTQPPPVTSSHTPGAVQPPAQPPAITPAIHR